ncbi:hypothetical protein AJ80_09277 [Polytolypa hystricis UAMH7299]|uniref:Uncharacterized protein n=1 Tax=Polytolypa hystricis (strain UAMH7299) TaxID=1447883 RepID=A0A2B7WST4_POLH7|nr:hypothetical protein AJ80_09277 [Polytolypa hystricis UAMH7299]
MDQRASDGGDQTIGAPPARNSLRARYEAPVEELLPSSTPLGCIRGNVIRIDADYANQYSV